MAIYGKYINDICISAEEIKRLSESLKIEDYNIEESVVGDLANAKLKKFCKDFDIDYKFVKDIMKAIGVKDTETSSKVGLFIGMVIHCTWNSLATFSKKFEELVTK